MAFHRPSEDHERVTEPLDGRRTWHVLLIWPQEPRVPQCRPPRPNQDIQLLHGLVAHCSSLTSTLGRLRRGAEFIGRGMPPQWPQSYSPSDLVTERGDNIRHMPATCQLTWPHGSSCLVLRRWPRFLSRSAFSAISSTRSAHTIPCQTCCTLATAKRCACLGTSRRQGRWRSCSTGRAAWTPMTSISSTSATGTTLTTRPSASTFSASVRIASRALAGPG